MKHLKIAGLCLVSLLVMSMAVSSTASAQVWEGCLEGGSTTKYENNKCAKAEPNGKFSWQEITNTDNVRGLGLTLRFVDKNAPLGRSEIVCPDSAEPIEEGTVGPGKFDKILRAKVLKPGNCIRVSGACKAGEVTKVEGIHLPWQTTLSRENSKILDTIENDGNGEPGWRIECNTLAGLQTDECESVEKKYEKTIMINELTGGVQLVRANFENRAEGKCSLGGAKAAELTGDAAILLANAKFEVSGIGLRVN
jgi:hypothetical protein